MTTKERIESADLEKMDEAQLEQEIAWLRARMQDRDHVHCTCNRCWQRANLAIVKHIVGELGLSDETDSERLQELADTLLGAEFWVRQGRTAEERTRQQALKQRCRRARRLLEEKQIQLLRSGLANVAGGLPDGTSLEATATGVHARVAGVVSCGKLIETERQEPEASDVAF